MFYARDFARILLADRFHPGGTALTQRIGEILAAGPGANAVDVESGHGISASRPAESFVFSVTGSGPGPRENVRWATAESQRSGQAVFHEAVPERLPFADASFDSSSANAPFAHFRTERSPRASLSACLNRGACRHDRRYLDLRPDAGT